MKTKDGKVGFYIPSTFLSSKQLSGQWVQLWLAPYGSLSAQIRNSFSPAGRV